MQRTVVLVIDDDEDIRAILSIRLQRVGFEVCTASDGYTGLSEVDRQQPDCVLLDLDMPGLDGFGFLQAISPIASRPYPVFVVTESDDIDPERLRQYGAEGLISKTQALDRSFADHLAQQLVPSRHHPGVMSVAA